MTISWKECGRNWSCPNVRYYPGIFREGLGKTTMPSNIFLLGERVMLNIV
jgi:hypothetical protein